MDPLAEFVPSGHAMHPDSVYCPVAEYVPAAHVPPRQVVIPVVSVNKGGVQFRHAVAPDTLLYVCMGHALHSGMSCRGILRTDV